MPQKALRTAPPLPDQPPPMHGPRLPEWSDEMPGSARSLVAGLIGWLWVPTVARGFLERGASTSAARGYRPKRWVDAQSCAVRLRHHRAATAAVVVWTRDMGDQVDPPGPWRSPEAWIWAWGLGPNGIERTLQVPVVVGLIELRTWLVRIGQEFE